jgi:DNA-binding SARP family transcriptional activator
LEELWADGGTEGAARTVQTYVSQLRKVDGEAVSLVTRPGGDVLEVDPGDLDAFRFEKAVTAAVGQAGLSDDGSRLNGRCRVAAVIACRG